MWGKIQHIMMLGEKSHNNVGEKFLFSIISLQGVQKIYPQ